MTDEITAPEAATDTPPPRPPAAQARVGGRFARKDAPAPVAVRPARRSARIRGRTPRVVAPPLLEAQAVTLEEGASIDRRATRTLYPTGLGRILGDALVGSPAAVVTHANPAAAERLLAYSPPAFSEDPTDYSRALPEGIAEVVLIAYPPDAGAVTPEG